MVLLVGCRRQTQRVSSVVAVLGSDIGAGGRSGRCFGSRHVSSSSSSSKPLVVTLDTGGHRLRVGEDRQVHVHEQRVSASDNTAKVTCACHAWATSCLWPEVEASQTLHGDGGKRRERSSRKGRKARLCNPRFQCRVPSFEERNSRRLEVDCLRRRMTNQRRTCLRTSSTLITYLCSAPSSFGHAHCRAPRPLTD